MITDRSELDTVWIPEVARRGWLIVTRDSRIQQNHAELAAVRDHRARMVALTGREAGTVWQQLEILLSRWRSIEALLDVPGPFIYRASRSALSPVDLGG